MYVLNIKKRPTATTVIVVVRIRHAKEVIILYGLRVGWRRKKNIYSCRHEILYTALIMRYLLPSTLTDTLLYYCYYLYIYFFLYKLLSLPG